jgi:RsiW-degrading membrane proteinase PrsW (M82 family)
MPAADQRARSASHRPAGHMSDLIPLNDWFRHHALRSFPVLLFLTLLCVPAIALVIFSANISATRFTVSAWIFAAYFAAAWLLLLGIIVRPDYVTRPMLALVIVISLVTQVPLAIFLETALHSTDTTFGLSVATVGVPEEVVKAIPVLVVAVLYRRRVLMPRDYLFLGAVSGLTFGAAEVVHYFTTNSVAAFYQTVQSASPAVRHLIATGHSAPASVFAVLVGPVWFFIIDFIWRFVTDPIIHACWAGVTGYFIGLAATRRYPWYLVAWIGLAIAAILHGLNDWSRVNGHPAWIFLTIASGVLFLGYSRVGARTDQQFVGGLPPFFRIRPMLTRQVPAPASEQFKTPAGRHAATPAEQLQATSALQTNTAPGIRTTRPWWQP